MNEGALCDSESHYYSCINLPGAEFRQGSHVLLRMVNSISTRTAVEGNYVYMKTATPIVANGQVVVPVDSYVQGIVVIRSAAAAFRVTRSYRFASRR